MTFTHISPMRLVTGGDFQKQYNYIITIFTSFSIREQILIIIITNKHIKSVVGKIRVDQ